MTEFTLKPAIMPPRPAGWRNYTAPNSAVIVPAPVKKMSPLLALTKKMETFSSFFNHTTDPETRPTIFIVYASVTGVAAGGAKRLASLCKAKCRVYLVNAADWDPAKYSKQLVSATLFLCVSSTYGSGNVPHHASSFLSWINSQKESQLLSGLHYSVLGFGSSAYPRFCEAAVSFDRSLEVVGCVRVAPLGKVDALSSSEFTFATWVVRVFSGLTDSMERESHELRANLANNDINHEIVSKLHMALDYFVSQLKPDLLHTAISHSIYYLTSDSSCSIACKWSNTQTGIVSNTRVLFETNNESGRESERVVTCVSCDVRQVPGGALYSPGDNVAIFPRQSEAAVSRAAHAFGVSSQLETVFGFEQPNSESGIGHAPFPTPTTVRKALQTFLGIESRPSVESLRRLIGYAKDSDAIRLTDTLSDSSGRAVDQWLLTNFITWVSFFELFPSLRVDSGGVPLSVLLDILPPQHPRYYSLASSLDASPDEFTLVVGQHSFAVSNDNDNGNDNDNHNDNENDNENDVDNDNDTDNRNDNDSDNNDENDNDNDNDNDSDTEKW